MSKITVGTMSFSSRDAKFPTMIANKYGLSTENIHKGMRGRKGVNRG